MKRFFCTVCGRVKRVRNYPTDITSSEDTVVEYRRGTCARHSIIPVHTFTPKVEVKLPTKAILNQQKSKRRA